MKNFALMTDQNLKKSIKRYLVDEQYGLHDRSEELAQALAESSLRQNRAEANEKAIFDIAFAEVADEIASAERQAYIVRSSVRAGEAEASLGDAIELADNRNGTITVFRVCGDSMIGAGIYDGDSVVANPCSPTGNVRNYDGRIVVAEVCGLQFVKRLMILPDGKITLVSENDKYKPYEIGNNSEFRVLGVVKQIIHNI